MLIVQGPERSDYYVKSSCQICKNYHSVPYNLLFLVSCHIGNETIKNLIKPSYPKLSSINLCTSYSYLDNNYISLDGYSSLINHNWPLISRLDVGRQLMEDNYSENIFIMEAMELIAYSSCLRARGICIQMDILIRNAYLKVWYRDFRNKQR